MRRWKEEGSDGGTVAGMDMNFVFQVYVSHYVCEFTFWRDRLWRQRKERKKESEREVLIASAAQKT